MTTPTLKLFPSVPLKNNDLEPELQKKLNNISSLNNSVTNIKEMITYFKKKNHKSKKKYRMYKTLTSMLESVNTVGIIGATTTYVTLSVTGVRLIMVPISAGIAGSLSLGNKVLHKIIINKFKRYKSNMKKTNQQLNLLINYIEKSYMII